jgi:hypothetical protein
VIVLLASLNQLIFAIMVTASQLQIVQSPITLLISTISIYVNVKLDDFNYLNWQFQMQLLLDGHGISGFVNGTHPCPARLVNCYAESSVENNTSNSSTQVENNEYVVFHHHLSRTNWWYNNTRMSFAGCVLRRLSLYHIANTVAS